MKKRLLLILAFILVLATPLGALAEEESPMAVKSFQPVKLDGEEVEISAYLVNGENYFRIRDLAAILKDTEAKFNVEFDPENENVILEKDGEYELIEGDLEDLPEGEQETIDSLHPVYLKGEEEPIEIKSYNINGNNYFRLRDLGKVLDFGVAYDYNNHTVLLSSIDLELEDIEAEEIEEVEEEGVEKNVNSEALKAYYNSAGYLLTSLELGTNEYVLLDYEDTIEKEEGINYIIIELNPFAYNTYQSIFFTPKVYKQPRVYIENATIEGEEIILTGTTSMIINGVLYDDNDLKIVINESNPKDIKVKPISTLSPEYLKAIGK